MRTTCLSSNGIGERGRRGGDLKALECCSASFHSPSDSYPMQSFLVDGGRESAISSVEAEPRHINETVIPAKAGIHGADLPYGFPPSRE